MTEAAWWKSDVFDIYTPVPQAMIDASGPRGPALVRAWPNGKTDSGWGMKPESRQSGFTVKYNAGEFNMSGKRILFGYEKRHWNFAFVMRSLQMICIDIDGKNGGLDNVGRLGQLPPTLAETSKSGDGYHLFYLTPNDHWDSQAGFQQFNDRVGIEQGVDIRAVGCVYHYPQQAWNNRPIVALTDHLEKRLLEKQSQAQAQVEQIIRLLDSGDFTEVAMMQDGLVSDLEKPIPAGRRNTTIYAIGSQMFIAGVPDWDNLVVKRALAVGLDVREADKIVNNIRRYAVQP